MSDAVFAPFFSRYAHRPCLRDGARILTYGETLALGRSIVAGIPNRRSLVILRCTLTADCVAAYLALLDAGHVPLLLETDLAVELMDQLAQLYRVDAIVDPFGGIELRSGGSILHPELALLLTTSGSTGSPKLVRLSQRAVLANAQAIAESLALDADERPLLHLPMSYSYGLSVIHSHLVTGGCIGLTRRSVMEPGYFEDLIAHQATSISGVPFHYAALRRLLAKIEAPSLRTLTQAGGRLDPKLVTFFAQWAADTGRRFIVMYGQTEAGPRIAALPPERALDAPEAIGLPIPDVKVHLVDERGDPVADGEAGEMIVESPGVMMGYANAPSDLALGEVLHNRLATGDIATRGTDGLLRIVGRRARLLKIFGLRVNVDEVEQRLADEGHRVICFGEDDCLRVAVEEGGEAHIVRKRIIDLFTLPPRGVEVRSVHPIARSASGKIDAASRDRAWEQAGPPSG